MESTCNFASTASFRKKIRFKIVGKNSRRDEKVTTRDHSSLFWDTFSCFYLLFLRGY